MTTTVVTLVPKAPASGGAAYNATPLTLADGGTAPPQINSEGDLKIEEQFSPRYEDNANGVAAIARAPLDSSTYAPSRNTGLGSSASISVKAAAGNVLWLYADNANAAVRYLQIHDSATAVAADAVPVASFRIPLLGAVTIDLSQVGSGLYCASGICLAISTVHEKYTAATASEHTTLALYK